MSVEVEHWVSVRSHVDVCHGSSAKPGVMTSPKRCLDRTHPHTSTLDSSVTKRRGVKGHAVDPILHPLLEVRGVKNVDW